MVMVQICVGSSCHLKGSPEVVRLFERYVSENGLDDEVILSGSVCSGKCNRSGVNVTVNDKVHTGVTHENVKDFWNTEIIAALRAEKGD